MQNFLEQVIKDIYKKGKDIENLIFVLPSKRAGTYLKKIITAQVGRTILSPSIYSIEEFIEHLAGISYANNTQQIFELYKAYLYSGPKEKESFESFLNWANTLLQDINEIDRYLLDVKSLFSNLSDIQNINHWSLKSEKTGLMENYLNFWEHLGEIYNTFNSQLLNEGIGHQGLVYRKAAENIDTYLLSNSSEHIFLGFNALNKSESLIIQAILDQTSSDIYWDIDPYFLNDQLHDAGLFIRNHHTTWPSLQKKTLKGLNDGYLDSKNINVIGVPKNTAQVKLVGNILKELQIKSCSNTQTAIVLGDESLLNPLMNAIPEQVSPINITMGLSLSHTSIASFFNAFIDLYDSRTTKGWFYSDVISFLTNPYASQLIENNGNPISALISKIKTRNWTYITYENLQNKDEDDANLLYIIFDNYDNSPNTLFDKCNHLVKSLKNLFKGSKNKTALEQLFKFHNLFNQITELISKYGYITSIKAFKNLYRQLLSVETLDFQGDPIEGLQVMGMLESRVLDFETVILTSVNEGILPSGKSNNSFIPFDLKIAYGLPTYKEKDAVYTYHFYRLLQRAKNVYLLYNTEPDTLEGGEKSRLITQLLTDENRTDITQIIATPKIKNNYKENAQVLKTKSLLDSIVNKGIKGFSPSSLSNYIRNPIDFYKQDILGIEDVTAVEETIAANTFGTIVHDTLEEIYTPFVGTFLNGVTLHESKSNIQTIVEKNFKKTYLDGNISTGKNYISFHVIAKYVEQFIDFEIKELKQHTIKLIALEKKLSIDLRVPGIASKITLKGKLDRIDEFNGETRILDYKSGRVDKTNVEIKEWDKLIEDYKYSKAFQLLCYSYMYSKNYPEKSITAGIISLKNLKEGTLLFAKKASPRAIKEHLIDDHVLLDFEKSLFILIQEIFDKNKPFVEKVV
ncbi:PD-(D/E)XK nuclease family protein [Maribacter sp. CXY002]|uniref:PD-(D/E)XK nuclease family protein n=1 Tax=Maribacter luteocoastalis TaxID=3407671 RepID=UPI003B6804CF